ncbi:MAG: glycosyltransferase N-terminal domain-containing protein, partial [Candidatus Caldarchaeum sp.]
ALMRVRPRVVAIMETELWMNFLHSAKLVGARTFLLNARLSSKAFQRARLLKFFYRHCLRYIDYCFAQSELDAERLRSLGKDNVVVMGNSKYDDRIEHGRVDWRKELCMQEDEKLLVVGSTRSEYEEDIVLQALRGLNVRVLFAPRHLERASFIVQRARSYGFDVGLRSEGETHKNLVVLDTFGELASAYSFAYVAIIGGGFEALGGQNVIQPLSVGCPVICGPHMFNFKQPVEEALAVGALEVASNSAELRDAIERLLVDPQERRRRSEAGKQLVERNKGAAMRVALEIEKVWNQFLVDS